MKPKDLGPAYLPKVRECTNFVTWNVKKIARDVGPRPAGGETVRTGAQIVLPQIENSADEKKTVCVALREKAETSDCAVLGALLIVVCLLLFLGQAIPAIAVSCVGALLTCLGRFAHVNVFSFLGKAREGEDTVLTRAAAGDVKKRVIFIGGLDSSRELRWNEILGPKGSSVIGIYALIGFVAGAALGAVALVSGEKALFAPGEWYRWIMFAFLPCAAALFVFENAKQPSPGVISNLTGALTGAAVLKFLGDNNVRFENTEVVCVLTDGRYAGCAGAKAYFSEAKSDAKTLVVAFDSLCDPRGVNLTGSMAAMARQAAEAAEVPILHEKYTLGVFEAAAGAKRGFDTVTIYAPGDCKYYRTRGDELKLLQPKSVEQALHTAVELCCMFDEA